VGLLDRFRPPAEVRLLRGEDVYAVPADVVDWQVLECVRLWAPGAARTGDGSVPVTEGRRLVGPIACDEDLRHQAGLPEGAVAAYAVPAGSGAFEHDGSGGHLLTGLARRLGGWVRSSATEGGGWERPAEPPVPPLVWTPVPYVFAARALSVEEARQLFTPHLPGLRLEIDDSMWYALRNDDAMILGFRESVGLMYPLVRRQSWFTSWQAVACYAVTSEAIDPTVTALPVADVLAAATTGLILDQDGFPWPGRP
jgi:hypothetical protein